MKKRQGIALIVLVITLIVIIILLSSVMLSLTNNNPLDDAGEVAFKTNAREYSTELDQIAQSSITRKNSNFDIDVSSSNLKNYITQIKTEDVTKYNIQNGELAYIGTSEAEGEYINEMDILNGAPPKMQTVKVPNVTTDSEGLTSAVATKDGKYVTITGMTVSSQRHSYINLLNSDYTLAKRVDIYVDNTNTYLTEVVVLNNGNIAVEGYIMDASYNQKAIMLLYSSNLDELKRETYGAPKVGYESWGRTIVNTSSGGYMVVTSANKYNAAKTAITDAYAAVTSYDANGNKVLDNIEVRGLDNSLFLVYDAVLSRNGNIYLCGNNYKNSKATPNVIGINSVGQEVYEYILTTTDPYGEYRYMSVLSDGTLALDRIGCTSAAGNPYDTAVETLDFLNVNDNTIKNIPLGIPVGLPKILNISTGYSDNVFVISVDSSGTPGIFKYKIFKVGKSGEIRWNIVGAADKTNVALRIIHPSKNKYIMFGQYKETSSSPYAAYVTDLIP